MIGYAFLERKKKCIIKKKEKKKKEISKLITLINYSFIKLRPTTYSCLNKIFFYKADTYHSSIFKEGFLITTNTYKTLGLHLRIKQCT